MGLSGFLGWVVIYLGKAFFMYSVSCQITGCVCVENWMLVFSLRYVVDNFVLLTWFMVNFGCVEAKVMAFVILFVIFLAIKCYV